MTQMQITGPFVKLPSKPTRKDLREARRTLEPLAAMGFPQAVEELKAVDALTRDLFPRVIAEVDDDGLTLPTRKRGRRAKRRLIAEEDCMGPCPTCRSSGQKRSKQDAREPGRGYIGDPLYPLMSGRIPCPTCKGTGWAPRGKAELNPLETMLHRTRRPLRGDAALQTFTGDGVPAEMESPKPHRWGYMGNAMVGPASAAEIRERRRWQPWWISPTDAADISAALEASAAAELRNPDLIPETVRGRRLVRQSRRDKRNLKPGQQKRAKMERRVRRYQADLDRQRRRETGWYTKQRAAAHLSKTLKAMGVELDSVFASLVADPPEPVLDPPVIAEAIRRGDLPPDADPMPQPSSAELFVRILHGRHMGKTGAVELGYIVPTHVLRLGDTVERVQRTVKVRFANGDFDMYDPSDVVPLAELSE